MTLDVAQRLTPLKQLAREMGLPVRLLNALVAGGYLASWRPKRRVLIDRDAVLPALEKSRLVPQMA